MDGNHPTNDLAPVASAPPPSPPVFMAVEGLTKAYEGKNAVADLCFEVRSGSILGLVGPNGAGKTTSMRCMAGIIPATAGRIAIAGYDLAAMPLEAKRRLAFVPDTPHLFDYLTVEEHLNFSARVYGVRDWKERAERLLVEFELEEKRRHLPAALSRGMRQKVAICTGFLHDPQAIILDEPLTGLDPFGIRAMKRTIVRRAREQGAAVIVSSHQLELVEEICDEVLIIDNGRKIISGTLSEIRASLGPGSETIPLEEIFFRVTHKDRAAAAATPLADGARGAP